MSRLDEKRFRALGVEWIARFDFNAQCAIEDDTGKGFYAFVAPMLFQLEAEDANNPARVLEALSQLRKSDMRLVLFHALSEKHDVTIDLVGDIIEDLGDTRAMEVVAWAIARAMPTASTDPVDDAGNGTPPRQRKQPTRKGGARPG